MKYRIVQYITKYLRTANAIAFTAILAANSAQGAKVPSNDVLTIGMSQEFENLNPLIRQMMATTYIAGFVTRDLGFLDGDVNFIASVATELPTIENGKMRLTGTKPNQVLTADWEIRSDAVWGDGTPITANDLVFSKTVALNDTVSVGDREVYSMAAKIDVDPANAKKFKVTYDKPRWDANKSMFLGFHFLPKHLEEPIYKKHGSVPEGYAKNSLFVKDPTNRGLYNGPYVVSEIKLGSHVTMVENPKWWGKKPAVKKIILKLIPNTGTLEANLRSGTIDMISVLGLKFDQALSFEKKVKEQNLPYRVMYKSGNVYEHIDLQLKDQALADLRVRKALIYAVDRSELVNALFEGKQQVALHSISPSDPWFTKDADKIVIYEPSKRTARKLLDEAGWKVGKDDYRYKDGKKLTFQFMTTAGEKTREVVETYLQNQWKQVGVELTVKNEPARVFFGETVRKGKYPHMAMYAWVSSPENNPKSTFHSKNIPTAKNGYSGQNTGSWSNERIDQILDSVDTEFDATKRLALIHELSHIYTDQVPVIPLYYRSDVSVVPKNLKGYKMTGHQYPETNIVEDWSLDPSQVL